MNTCFTVMGDHVELVAGCCEQIVFGYRVLEWAIEPNFTHHAHTASCFLSSKSCIYLFRGHVTSLSVHPSGKLALSVGTDKTLRTWNLIEGRSAFIKNLKQNAEIVLWSPDGDQYAVVGNDRVDIYILKSATITGTIAFTQRISCVKFLKVISLIGVFNLQLKCCFLGLSNVIVKAIETFMKDDFCVLVTASNDGFIKLWKLNLENLETPSLLGQVNTTARLTCLSIWKPGEAKETSTEQSAQPEASIGAVTFIRVSADFHRQNPVVSIGIHPSGNFEILQQVQVGHMNLML
uniref:PAK1 interacting protein 1 n=1 Tax=Sinocyclocheilus grahami TaxID=75366 RepID=A0A672S3Q0_SINGR